MDHFELFEKVTGRISLKTGKVLEEALKEACRKTGAQYREAADEILITGTWEQVSDTRRIVMSRILDGPERASSSSSDHSEGVTSKPGRQSFNTIPPVAKYIKCFHDDELKNIEQSYKVKITWSKDYTTVQIRVKSEVNSNNDLFNSACDQFADIYQRLHRDVTKITYNVSKDGTEYNHKLLEEAFCCVPRFVHCLIFERSADGSEYTLWGTTPSLSQATRWIREKVGMNRPRSVSPKSPPKHALTHETENKLKVVVYEGNITKENTDVIVNACNKFLDHAGGVSYAISKAGGPNVQKESDDYVKKNGALKTGYVAVTGAGFLHCKHIVHAVGPQWSKHGKERTLKLFKKVFMNVYEAAVKLGAKSIAMPAISSGIYGVPKEVCAQAAFSFVDEIDQILASDPAARPFEIRLVNIDGEIAKTFSQEYTNWLFKGRKVKRRHSFTAKAEIKVAPNESKSVDDMHKTPRFKDALFSFHTIQQSSVKDGRSLDGTSATSSAQLGSTGTSSSSIKCGFIGTSGTSSIKHGYTGTSAFSVTSNSKVNVTTVASTSLSYPSSTKPPSSPSFGNQSKFNTSTGVNMHTSTSGSLSQHGAVLSTGQTLAGGKHGKSGSKTVVRYDQNGSHSSLSGEDSSDCPICFCPCTNPVPLPKCGHTFCKSCIETAFTYQKKCPICQEVYGVFEGDQPEGTMDVKPYPQSLPGYEGCGYYVITYVIPSGRQDDRHPKPGQKFTGTKRRAYLPATKEGNVVLKMLQKAFEKKLIFTVGKSNTTGQEDCVTWNDIHHKTNISGGPQGFGYPDPGYLNRVKDELKAKGIVPE